MLAGMSNYLISFLSLDLFQNAMHCPSITYVCLFEDTVLIKISFNFNLRATLNTY